MASMKFGIIFTRAMSFTSRTVSGTVKCNLSSIKKYKSIKGFKGGHCLQYVILKHKSNIILDACKASNSLDDFMIVCERQAQSDTKIY